MKNKFISKGRSVGFKGTPRSLSLIHILVGRTVTFSVWLMDYWWVLLVLVFIAGIFLSGYYPALALLNRKPITLLKGKFLHSKSGERTRQVLVIIQYTASMLSLIHISSLVLSALLLCVQPYCGYVSDCTSRNNK